MSGFEAFGVLFGVLPILIEAIKGYARLSDKIHTFRHYPMSAQVRLKVQKQIFYDECRLLLCLVVEDDQKAMGMLEDTSDERWQSKELNDKMNSCLKGNFELCTSIIEGSKMALEHLEADLKKFDVLVEQKLEVDSPNILLPVSQF